MDGRLSQMAGLGRSATLRPAWGWHASNMTGHRTSLDWTGSTVETLADLLPPTPRAICVGINPAPRSVEIGHYYQGNLGQRLFGRLRRAGLLIDPVQGFEDDQLFGKGIGFTDIVKRPTASADQVTLEERKFGSQLLADKLREAAAPVLICAFKDAAVALVGKFDGNGWLSEPFAGARVFVMPGPYESNSTALPTIESLATGLPDM